MAEKLWLSVLMSVHNMENNIASLLDSVCMPGVENTEYVLTDRGSEDRTLYRAIRRTRELGMTAMTLQNGFGTAASALNAALCHANGAYISFITPQAYGVKLGELCRSASQSHSACDIFLPVPEAMLSAPKVMSGQNALELLVYTNCIPEFGIVLFSRRLLMRKNLWMTDMPQMAGLGLEFTIKALANAGSVMLIPMDATPVGVRKELFINTKIEFSAFCRVDAIYRAVEAIQGIEALRPSILDGFFRYYLPQKLIECVEELLNSGLGYSSVMNYIRMHDYDRFWNVRGITDKQLKHKITMWRRLPWMYRPERFV